MLSTPVADRWNPACESQAADRIHRLGQYKPITVVRFIIAGTVGMSTTVLTHVSFLPTLEMMSKSYIQSQACKGWMRSVQWGMLAVLKPHQR